MRPPGHAQIRASTDPFVNFDKEPTAASFNPRAQPAVHDVPPPTQLPPPQLPAQQQQSSGDADAQQDMFGPGSPLQRTDTQTSNGGRRRSLPKLNAPVLPPVRGADPFKAAGPVFLPPLQRGPAANTMQGFPPARSPTSQNTLPSQRRPPSTPAFAGQPGQPKFNMPQFPAGGPPRLAMPVMKAKAPEPSAPQE